VPEKKRINKRQSNANCNKVKDMLIDIYLNTNEKEQPVIDAVIESLNSLDGLYSTLRVNSLNNQWHFDFETDEGEGNGKLYINLVVGIEESEKTFTKKEWFGANSWYARVGIPLTTPPAPDAFRKSVQQICRDILRSVGAFQIQRLKDSIDNY
jgi:hypothetical protein